MLAAAVEISGPDSQCSDQISSDMPPTNMITAAIANSRPKKADPYLEAHGSFSLFGLLALAASLTRGEASPGWASIESVILEHSV